MESTLNIQRGKYLEHTRLVYAVPCPIWMQAYRCVRVSMCVCEHVYRPAYIHEDGREVGQTITTFMYLS